MPESPFGADVGKQPGLEIWRIENFAPVPYDKKSYGKFYSGDSYIVLNTRLSGDKLKWDIHFWLGKDTSQDEMGAAAIFAVELDDHLGGVPVQHREVQEYESSMFLANFPGGVRYLDGGVASGFKHVDPDQVEKKLLQVKGKRNVRIRQVPLDVSSMNKGDCFVLDAGKVIYVYMGNGSKKIERLKAIQAANQVRDQDHAGKARIVILDEFSGGGDITTFFNELGSGSPMEVPEGSTEDDDISFEKQQQSSVILFRVSDASGQLVIEEIGQKPLQQSMLKREDCFILDTAGSGLFVWIGRGCTKAEKLEAMNVAQKFLTEKGYPIWTKASSDDEKSLGVEIANLVSPGRELVPINEGEEPQEFWDALGGKGPYTTVQPDPPPVLKDLVDDDVMVLDSGHEIYVWIGLHSTDQERAAGFKMAQEYLKTEPSQRSVDSTLIFMIHQRQEPESFIDVFPTWNRNMWKEQKTYEQIKAEIMASNGVEDDE